MSYMQQMTGFLASRWRVWLPPIVLTVLVFGVLVVLTEDTSIATFAYRLF